MKSIFLIGLFIALNIITLTPEASAQDAPKAPKPPKEKRIVIVGKDTIINGNVTRIPTINDVPNRDSLINAMNKLGEEMGKLTMELKKSSFNAGEKYQAKIEKEMLELGDEMEKLGAEIEREMEELERELESSELEREIEAEVEAELEKEMEGAGNEESASKDTSKNKTITITDDGIHIRTGKNSNKPKNVVKAPKNSATDFLLVDFGINSFIHKKRITIVPTPSAEPLELNLPKSVNVTLHFFRTGINLYRHKLYTTFGIAYDMHDYRLSKNVTLQPDTNRFAVVDEGEALKKNKLSAQYVTLPLMLHYETNPMKPSRSFKLGFGGWGGFLANAYTKQITEKRGKQHRSDNYNLNQLNYGVRAQVGYGMFTLYSQYALSPLFKENVGAPELNPITFGVILNGFKWN